MIIDRSENLCRKVKTVDDVYVGFIAKEDGTYVFFPDFKLSSANSDKTPTMSSSDHREIANFCDELNNTGI